MITNGTTTYEFRGLSTDNKNNCFPLMNGNVFFEMDTGKAFMYNEASQTWVEI